ncbi:MAG: hypothetical protein IAE77_29130, partial [Prosthecobacter sp.]|uniref:hypothetical protein n=1 Tax=Prosthecobacter sp. TaxID=1965333 RepID=UPI001A0E8B1E
MPPLSSALAAIRTQATYSTGHVIETTYDGLKRPHLIAKGGCLTRHGYDLNCLTKRRRSRVLGIGFFQKASELFRHFFDRSLNVKPPQLLAHIRRRLHFQLL